MSLRFAAAPAALLLLLAAPAARAQFSIGPRLGLNASTFRTRQTTYDHQTRPLLGWQLGAEAQWRIGSVALRPSVAYSRQGARFWERHDIYSNTGGTSTVIDHYRTRNEMRINALNLAFNVAYAPRWARHVEVFAGGYAGLNVGGFISEVPEQDQVQGYPLYPTRYQASFNPIQLGGGRVDAAWYDAGLTTGLGYQRGRWLAQLQQSWGLTDLDVVGFRQTGAQCFTRVTSLSFTYLLGPKPQPDFMLD
jgi:Outer membrane protein beta-barrel domain